MRPHARWRGAALLCCAFGMMLCPPSSLVRSTTPRHACRPGSWELCAGSSGQQRGAGRRTHRRTRSGTCVKSQVRQSNLSLASRLPVVHFSGSFASAGKLRLVRVVQPLDGYPGRVRLSHPSLGAATPLLLDRGRSRIVWTEGASAASIVARTQRREESASTGPSAFLRSRTRC
jgi:hypothetical protein